MRFVILSDSKGKDKGINEKVLTKLLKLSSSLNPKPEFIVLGGDNVAGSTDKNELIGQLQRLRTVIGSYHPNLPLLPVVGNHEVNIEPVDDSYEKIFKYMYRDTLPSSCIEGYNNTVYYKDCMDTRIIVLNSFHYGELNKIGEEQLAWLEKAASKPVRNKFVFVHSPAFPTGAHYSHCLDLHPKYRDVFWMIVERCGIDIVFSGHEHNYSRRIIEGRRSVPQIITGGAGEKLRDKYQDKNGVVVPPIAKYHFVIVDVNPERIRTTAVSDEGKMLDRFEIKKHTNSY